MIRKPGSAAAAVEASQRHRAALPYFVLLGAQVAVGAAALMARAGLESGLDPWSLSAWRLSIASAVLLAAAAVNFVRRGRQRRQARIPVPQHSLVTGTTLGTEAASDCTRQRSRTPADRYVHTPAPALRLTAAGACLALHFAAWFASLQHLSVAVSTLLVNTGPLWAGLGGVLILRDRLPGRFWLGVAAATVGAYATVAGGEAHAIHSPAAAEAAGHPVAVPRKPPATRAAQGAVRLDGAAVVAAPRPRTHVEAKAPVTAASATGATPGTVTAQPTAVGNASARPGAALPRAAAQATAWGITAALVGAVAMAAYMLLVQDLQERIGTRRVVAWTYTSAAFCLWPVALIQSGPHLLPSSYSGWLAVFGLAIVSQLVGHTALNWSLRHFPAGIVSAATLLEPVVAAALAWTLLGEQIGAMQVVGAAVLLAGIALATMPERITSAAIEPSL